MINIQVNLCKHENKEKKISTYVPQVASICIYFLM